MLKEHERREYLKGLDQDKREKEEERLAKLREKHQQHPKINAPVGGAAAMLDAGGRERSSLTPLCSRRRPGERRSAAGSLGGDGRAGSSGVQPQNLLQAAR